jgi:hypothetical protein
MKYLKLFESFNEIQDEVKEILGYLTDEGYKVEVRTHNSTLTKEITKLIVAISLPRLKEHGGGGYPFRLAGYPIMEELNRLIDVIGDRYHLVMFSTDVDNYEIFSISEFREISERIQYKDKKFFQFFFDRN